MQLSHFAKLLENLHKPPPPRFNAILGHKSGRGFHYFFLPFPVFFIPVSIPSNFIFFESLCGGGLKQQGNLSN
jgi:hypothetical protein